MKLHVETERSREHTGCQLEVEESASIQGKGRTKPKRLTDHGAQGHWYSCPWLVKRRGCAVPGIFPPA